MPYRVAAPPPADPPEEEEPYLAVLRAQRRRARIASAAVVVAVALGGAQVARSHTARARQRVVVTEVERAERARVAIARARDRAALMQSRFETDVRAAVLGNVGPRPDLGACPVQLPSSTSLVRGRAAFPLLTLAPTELRHGLLSLEVAGVLADAHRAEQHVAAGRYEEATLYARALDREDRFRYDVVLITTAATAPRAVTGAEYVPGEITGRAYLYDFGSRAVVCAADVHAASSKTVGYVYSDHHDAPPSLGPVASMGEAVAEDLRLQTERVVARAMQWRAGPLGARTAESAGAATERDQSRHSGL